MFDFLKKLIFTEVHAARTSTEDPLQKFLFRVTIPGFPVNFGFTTVGPLSEEIAVATYQEGGYDNEHKLPGRITVPEVVCERGAYAGDTTMKDAVKKAVTDPNFRCTITIEELTRFKAVARTFKLGEAWISRWEGGDSDASSDDVRIESFTIQFEKYL